MPYPMDIGWLQSQAYSCSLLSTVHDVRARRIHDFPVCDFTSNDHSIRGQKETFAGQTVERVRFVCFSDTSGTRFGCVHKIETTLFGIQTVKDEDQWLGIGKNVHSLKSGGHSCVWCFFAFILPCIEIQNSKIFCYFPMSHFLTKCPFFPHGAKQLVPGWGCSKGLMSGVASWRQWVIILRRFIRVGSVPTLFRVPGALRNMLFQSTHSGH